MATGAQRILVVDDDPKIRGMVKLVLETEGYEVDLAEDGYAALRAVEATHPDCVVLDVMMPGMDGHDVLGRIRGSAQSTTPVVMLTAAADDDQAWAAWSKGVDYFLAKPFDASELLGFLSYLFKVNRTA